MLHEKKEYGVNGEHRVLGREFDMHEFKGYTISEIRNIKDILKEMKQDNFREMKEMREQQARELKVIIESCNTCRTNVNVRVDDCEKDIKDLNAFKNRVLGLAALAGIAATALFNLGLGLLAKAMEFFK